jgi:dTDP-glucose 4,6-dehydratase
VRALASSQANIAGHVQTHVDNSFGNSLEFTMNNTFGTHVLLEAARKWGNIRRFINVSTDEVYGETSLGKDAGCDETTTLEPTNPYSAAKAGAEMMVRSYMTSYKLPCIITRGNNVYGPHQFPEKLIPKMTLLAHKGAKLPVHGSGKAVRSYLHVRDVARAFDTVLHKGIVGQVYNIGTQKERSVLEVVNSIAKYLGETGKISHVEDRAFNDQRCALCACCFIHLCWWFQPGTSAFAHAVHKISPAALAHALGCL